MTGMKGRPAARGSRIQALEQRLKATVDGEVRFDTTSRALYTTDGSNYRMAPIGVVVPRTVDAAVACVAACHSYSTPILPRGGGTALAGQSCNEAVMIDFSKYVNRVLDIDTKAKTARVEPGAILDTLRSQAERHRLTFGPDPATHTHNSLGGMIGNNSCGIHSVMAGRTSDNVLELDVLTYDGVRMTVGETSPEQLDAVIDRGGRMGDLYAGMRDIGNRYAHLIRERYPDIPRRVSGYNLDELLPEKGFNAARALVGTEGTCAVVLGARLRLVDSPPARSLLVLGYPDVYHAADHVMQIMEHDPVGLEGIDDKLIQYMHLKKLHTQNLRLLPEGNGWLLVEFGGETKQEAQEKAREVETKLKRESSSPATKVYTDIEEEETVWKIRESGLGATANVPTLPLCWPGWEDAAVRPEALGGYLREFRSLLDEFKYVASLYGHFGQGCVHCRISFDLFSHQGIRDYCAFTERAADLVLRYGGSFSGEHGDGQSRADLLPKMYGSELVNAFREFKRVWDPLGKMNPGKSIDSLPRDQNLRLGVEYNPWDPPTVFRFPGDKGSFARATLRCVGVGKCRRPGNAFMCPSFIATREELHTTRGRARMLFEMFTGELITDKWNSKEVLEALDLCLGCKGCVHECPVNVNIPAYKSEFLHHHYAFRPRPMSAYSLGLIGYWTEYLGRRPRLLNFVTQTPLLCNVTKLALGMTQRRRLPVFAQRPFTQWEASQPQSSGQEKRVALIPDVYNNFFTPRALIAAKKLLEYWGFSVVTTTGRVGSVRSLLHFGMLTLAKNEFLRYVRLLREYASAGVPILFMEPSEAAVFRDDGLNLLPNNLDAKRVADLTCILSEFIVEKDLPLPQAGGGAIIHAHCHQKASLKQKAFHTVMRKMNIDFQEPWQGCCGLAGPFGFERAHYDVSMKIGEQKLFPAVRRASLATRIIAEGYSCRKQIEDGTGRKARHLSEVIWEEVAKRS